jgi:hypothetical protein
MKLTRHLLAKAAWQYRRQTRDIRLTLADVKKKQLYVLSEIARMDDELKIGEPKIQRLKANVQILSANQQDVMAHFHTRLERIESKWAMSHDQAVARLALRGLVLPPDTDEKKP